MKAAAILSSAGFTAFKRWKHTEIILVAAIVLIVALLVLPLPPLLLDLFLAGSFAASLLILLVALNNENALEFSSFPALLLIITLFRLALNVNSTRLILAKGEAGSIIRAFGEFVIGGNFVVGVVIFLILVLINFIVITKGAGRVAEVAARFTLDAMPGRQMSIDGDLSAGLIDDAEAKQRREEVTREADFYGAMDGASKFVKGDAIAGLLITGINILGGIFIGVVQRGLPIGRAVSEYTILTVGDGLVSQIPALIVSTAAGIMVTHTSNGAGVGAAVLGQLGRSERPLWMAAAFMMMAALVPGLPTLPFLALASATGGAAWWVAKTQRRKQEEAEVAAAAGEGAQAMANPIRELLQIDPLELEIGYSLISLVDESQGGDLLERIRLLRRQAAQELGILVPSIRLRDNVALSPTEYVLKLRGSEIARSEVMPRHLLALDTGTVLDEVDGIAARDPSFGMPARWIVSELRSDAEASGYVVVEPTMVVATHLLEMLKVYAADLLGRQDVQEMVDTLKQSYPALVEEVVPAKVPLGVLHRVLQRLLRERVPIRDLTTILEALADVVDQTRDPEALTEHVRQALSNVIAERHMDESGVVRAITIGPRLEASLMELFNVRQNPQRAGGMIEPETLTHLLTGLDQLARNHAVAGQVPPLISPPGLRVGVRRLIEPVLPHIPVVSLAELPPQTNLQQIAAWELGAANSGRVPEH